MKTSTIIALVAGVAILGIAGYFLVFKKSTAVGITPPIAVPRQVNLNSVNATAGGFVGQLATLGLGKLEDKLGDWFD